MKTLQRVVIITNPELTFDPSKVDQSSFFGTPAFELNQDGYTLTIAEPFGFKDSKGIVWEVPKGFVTDGAPIPRAFWSILGAPLTGKLRLSAILHDYYSTQRTRSMDDVNRMFLESMRKASVDEKTAWILYTAVVNFGPRWSMADTPLSNIVASDLMRMGTIEADRRGISEFEQIRTGLLGDRNCATVAQLPRPHSCVRRDRPVRHRTWGVMSEVGRREA